MHNIQFYSSSCCRGGHTNAETMATVFGLVHSCFSQSFSDGINKTLASQKPTILKHCAFCLSRKRAWGGGGGGGMPYLLYMN